MTREEAIRRIKAWNLDSDDREVLAVIIPELAESEDERMLREIKRYIKEQGDKPNGLPNGTVAISDMIAWLEKQQEQNLTLFNEYNPDDYEVAIEGNATSLKRKEQKPVDLSEMMVHKEPDVVPVPTPMVADEQKPVDYEAELKKCKDNPLYFFDKYVSIKLKPMKWSEEDEKMCNSILNVLTPHLVYDGTYTGTTLGKKYKYGSEIRWIKSLPERFNLQPKEEQSKYDGNMDKECIKLCNTLNSIPSVNTFESCCGHLKDSYSVWFFCNDIIAISRLGRSVDRNYSDGKWELVVDSTDTHPTGVFWLRSKVPFQDYDEMEESVNELCVCIQYWFNTKFDSYFNDDACK